MISPLSRRAFLATASTVGTLAALRAQPAGQFRSVAGIMLVDYHVHLDDVVTLEKAIEISKTRGVKFGIVEHAGTKENKYRGLLSSDDDLKRYLAFLEGKPVYKGVQAEGLDWVTCFSKELVAKLDYVLTDALTFPEKDGKRVELWRPWVKVTDKQDFMDRYTDYNVRVITAEPIDLIANPTFLPACIEKEHDALWTPVRMKKIIDAAVKHNVAIEINSRYRLPSVRFLEMAKQAGAKFSLGSNIHGLDVGTLDYGVEMIRALNLKPSDIFTPAPPGKKPIQLRKFA